MRRARVASTAQGTLLVQRPGEFRWDYMPQTAASGAAASPAAPPHDRQRAAD